ncbi:MAG: ABC transporter ATP-binding protein [Clostridiales bacterium]|nr:ABC transporter ATP-binding protein [Clostridiales bacterium]
MIRLEHVRMSFAEKEIFSNLSLTFASPGQYAILGPSGRGKTTLLRLIAGLEKPLSGDICVPQDVHISFCFQEDRLLPWKTVLENVMLVCGDRAAAQRWLGRVGLGAEADSYPASLSGGMKRRASLARALAYDAPILLMDEPFRALDDATHAQMLALVRETAKGKLLILVTHDETDADGMTVVRL